MRLLREDAALLRAGDDGIGLLPFLQRKSVFPDYVTSPIHRAIDTGI